MSVRVVHVVGTLRDGGAETLLRGLLPKIAAEPDIDLHVVSVYDSRLAADEVLALRAHVHEIGKRDRRDVGFAPRLVSTLRRLAPDIVHGHIHTGKYAGRMAAIAAGVPNLVFTEHGDEAGGGLRSAIKRVLNVRTARFIVFTESERERYAREEGIPVSKIVVIPNGIPAPPSTDIVATRAELGLHEGDFAIASPARLVPQKNQELLLRAMAALRSAGRRNARLYIMGDGPDAGALRGLASELELDDAVRFLGYRKDAVRLTAACDIMALSSRWEKMPLVLGEAMLAGVAVVSTPWTGVESFIENNQSGYLAEDWSAGAFALALHSSMDDPVKRRTLAGNGMRLALERFDLSRSARLHADLYRELSRS